MTPPIRRNPVNWWIALPFLFLFRLLYGLSKFSGQDEFQVYLIGLKYFTGGIFPFWGADIVHTRTQIPGGLQGALVGWPFFAVPVPEAPYVLLNLLSFSSLAFLAWYICRRLPDLSPWLVYGWVLTAPWTLHFTTHVENPSYALIGSVLFFIGTWELLPIYKTALLSPRLSFFMLGFSLCWILQLHMSWVLLLPFLALVFWYWRERGWKLWQGVVFFGLGSLLSGLTLLPLLLEFGWNSGGDTLRNVGFHPENLKWTPLIFARFFSFASYEVARFIGPDNPFRIQFLKDYFWVIPFAVPLFLLGMLQLPWLLAGFFRKMNLEEGQKVKTFTLFTIALVSASFCCTVVQPAAHTFYIVLPVAMWYFFYCCQPWVQRVAFRRIAWFMLIAGLVFQSALLIRNMNTIGLYKNREAIVKAINQQDYTFLGLRRVALLEEKNREKNWKQKFGSGSIRYLNDFEYTRPYFRPQNIVSTQAGSGSFSCKMDSIQAYCLDFQVNASELKGFTKAHVSFEIRIDPSTKILLVTDVYNAGTRVFWEGNPVSFKQLTAADWQRVDMDIQIPTQLPPESVLSIYCWMPEPGRAVAYLDNVEIELSQEK